MVAVKLVRKVVKKPWGRFDLPSYFADEMGAEKIGEIWFEHPNGADEELLIKFLFTSERLSIQVHPDDNDAVARGYLRGKEEAWYILDATEDARIGIGIPEPISRESLHQAALDGSIVDRVDWRRVQPGEVLYSPAGMIHAIGSGLTLIEVQQNVDLTYRLYDYGRPRELHLEDGLAVAKIGPYHSACAPQTIDQRLIHFSNQKFVLEEWTHAVDGILNCAPGSPIWVVPVAGDGNIDGQMLQAGDVWLCEGQTPLQLTAGGKTLIAYLGREIMHDILTPGL